MISIKSESIENPAKSRTHQESAQLSRNFQSRQFGRIDFYILACLLVMAAIMFLPGLGSTGILNTSDSYYAEGAREMLERGEFIVPQLNYQPYFEKPILTYWLIAVSYKLFGVNTLASRLPSALCAILLVCGLYALSRGMLRRRTAFFSALILLCTPALVATGHLALTDLPFTCFLGLGMLMLMQVLVRKSERLIIPAYACIGLAFLAKGPLALVIPAITISLYSLLRERKASGISDRIRKARPELGLMVIIFVCAPWYLAVHFATEGEFTRYFFIEQNLGRFSGALGSHVNPCWFYVPHLLGGFMPWTLLLIQSLIIYRRRIKRSLSKIVSAARKHLTDRSEMRLFAIAWASSLYLLLSISSSKLGTYLLPLYPALALLAGSSLDSILRLDIARKLSWISLVLLFASAGSFILIPYTMHSQPAIMTIILLVNIGIFIALINLFIQLRRCNRSALPKLFLPTIYLSCALIVPLVLSFIYRKNNLELHDHIKQARLGGASLAMLERGNLSAPYYLRKPVPVIKTREDLLGFLRRSPGPHWLLVSSKDLFHLTRLRESYRAIDKHGKWLLYFIPASDRNNRINRSEKNF